MKKYIILIFICISAVFYTSCKEYLDKAPEQGLSEEEIFTNADNFRLFFNQVYEGQFRYNNNNRDLNIKTAFPLYFNYWDQKYTWEGITDAADQGRYMEGHNFKSGSVIGFVDKFINDGNRRPILKSMFASIRVANISLDKIDQVKDISDEEKNDLIGQAHFIRAFCHFELFRIWGPMPYLTKAIGEDDQWDMPRLSKHETLIKIAQDFDTAFAFLELAGKVRRDPPSGAGHLADPDQSFPNGVAALAYKSRALLYAASPLNNELGAADWQNAAAAAWEAFQIAEASGYELLSAANRKENYYAVNYTNEQLWAWYAGEVNYNDGRMAGLYNGIFGNSKTSWSGVCPTQNFVDKYETANGWPLNTEADRAAATAAGHYNEQNPFDNRDPRLATDIITNQSPCKGWTGGKAHIYIDRATGVTKYSELLDQAYLGITRTGYYLRKNWPENSPKSNGRVRQTDPLFRLAELYLNYAEASNEAYGPSVIGVPGATWNAIEAINIIRDRMGQEDVLPQFTGSTEIFRDRIKNERNIELSWEGHYYHDIRRWMDAPAAYGSSLYGMIAEKVPVSAEFPTGFKYVRTRLGNDRQPSWKPAMYYLPFNTTDNFKMKNFVPNVVW